jgi:hypothetical protein
MRTTKALWQIARAFEDHRQQNAHGQADPGQKTRRQAHPIRTKQSPQRTFATPQASDQRLAFR